jgi:alkylation response protein AidB-like acyl-CoA dehydrogenase
MAKAAPPAPGEERTPWRGAFALTEPLPFVGVETNILSGKVRIAEWTDGQEPLLQVDKRGRFITNMGFANFVTAAVDSADERISRSCMIVLEQGDPGVFDAGTPTKKLVHQLSSTTDPVFSLRVPASRIIGGYSVKDGKIVPHYSHSEVIEAVFRRTRVTVGLMSAAKLLSAIEPVIRYHRHRFRGGESANPGSPRYELGLQGKEDVLHRLVDVWATGEAASSLGFAAARLFDELDPLERAKEDIFAQQKIEGARAQFRALQKVEKEALEFLALAAQPEATRDGQRYEILAASPLVQFAWRDALANVLCPAVKLWNTGQAATMMREAVSLVGGYGITEDCPGFLGQKWMDVQLEATYEGPEAVQRRQLSVTMTGELFLAQFQHGIDHLAQVAASRPGTGACTLGTAMQLWLWTLHHLGKATDPEGRKLFHSNRQGVSFPLADALCWLLAARQFLLDVLELEAKGPANPTLAEGLEGLLAFLTDLCHVQSARAAGEVGRICAELVFGYQRHPAWDGGNCAACYSGTSGPGECLQGLEEFVHLRARLDGCLTGARLAKERAAEALTKVMIPEALDYPQ